MRAHDIDQASGHSREERGRQPSGADALRVSEPAPDPPPASDLTDRHTRERIAQALRHVALGVCAASGETLFQTIVDSLTKTLGVDLAFISELPAGCETHVGTRAVSDRGQPMPNLEYGLAGTPCRLVLDEGFQFIGDDLSRHFPADNMLSDLGAVAYAGYPLLDSAKRPIGLVALLHRKPLTDPGLIEAVLQIYSVRAAAELDRQRSEASYRAIFEAAEDAIFVHDLTTGAIYDANPAACRIYGYSHEEMLQLNPAQLSSGIPPYDQAGAARWIGLASDGQPQRFEWHRRNKDGSLHWPIFPLQTVREPSPLLGWRAISDFTWVATS